MARERKVTTQSSTTSLQSRSPSSARGEDLTKPLAVLQKGGVEQREPVKVNNASVTEMKIACDDALKRFLSRPELFSQIHTHTDVRLALGWAAVLTASGTAFYGWKIEFEESKPVVLAGLILYLLFTTIQTLYSYFIEGDVVFVGKRKTFAKRIVTDRITVSSRTHQAVSTSACPEYSIDISYILSTSGGKGLLAKGKKEGVKKGYNEFYDVHGTLDQARFERWVAEVVEEVMGMD